MSPMSLISLLPKCAGGRKCVFLTEVNAFQKKDTKVTCTLAIFILVSKAAVQFREKNHGTSPIPILNLTSMMQGTLRGNGGGGCYGGSRQINQTWLNVIRDSTFHRRFQNIAYRTAASYKDSALSGNQVRGINIY